MTKKILIADDDEHICEVVSFALEKADMQVTVTHDGKQALDAFRNEPSDLIVLDISMPEMDGLEMCRELRKFSDVPVLFLSSRDDEIDRVLGLELGGDDYVTKPFSPRELVARINAILKRTHPRPTGNSSQDDNVLTHGNLNIYPDQHRATWQDSNVTLTATEFNMLHLLARSPTRVFNRDHIMQHAYDSNVYVSDRTIDSHIRHIRQKFNDAGCEAIIETVHGVGYKLARG